MENHVYSLNSLVKLSITVFAETRNIDKQRRLGRHQSATITMNYMLVNESAGNINGIRKDRTRDVRVCLTIAKQRLRLGCLVCIHGFSGSKIH